MVEDDVFEGTVVFLAFMFTFTFDSRSRFVEQKFICDLGIDPQRDTFTVIFKLPDMILQDRFLYEYSFKIDKSETEEEVSYRK